MPEHKFAAIHRQYLYRYRPSHKQDADSDKLGYLASALRDRIIYVPTVEQFNDPWDTAPTVSVSPDMSDEELVRSITRLETGADPSPEELRARLEGFTKQTRTVRLNQMRHIFSGHSRKFAVLCLSNDYRTPLLWSYYAGGHTGYVLEFATQMRPIAAAVKVTYDDDFPAIDPTYKEPSELAKDVLFVKGEFWRHEREWRLLVPAAPSEKTQQLGYEYVSPVEGQPRPPGVYLRLPEGAITSVTLGVRMPDKPKSKILQFIRDSKIQIAVYEEEIGADSFVVERRPHPDSPVKPKD